MEETAFLRYSHNLLLAFCFIVNLSIGPAQIFLSLFLLYWLAFTFSSNGKLALSDSQRFFYAPLVAWLLVCFLATFAGVHFGRAFEELVKLSFYALTPLAVTQTTLLASKRPEHFQFRIRAYLWSLIAGQTLAAIHTILTTSANVSLSLSPPGPVTQSGQPRTCALWNARATRHRATRGELRKRLFSRC